MHKAIEDTGIKLGCVATDIMGKSGRAMLDALVAGTKDPEVLADLARGQLRKKLPALREALDGRPPPDEISLQSSRRPHREVLDTIGALIERAETRALALARSCMVAGRTAVVGRRTASAARLRICACVAASRRALRD